MTREAAEAGFVLLVTLSVVAVAASLVTGAFFSRRGGLMLGLPGTGLALWALILSIVYLGGMVQVVCAFIAGLALLFNAALSVASLGGEKSASSNWTYQPPDTDNPKS